MGNLIGSFDYSIGFNKSADHANADGLLRHPVDKPFPIDAENNRIQHDHFESLPVDWKQVRNRSRVDPVVSQAIRYTLIGWPEICPTDKLRPFSQRRYELTLQEDCLLWAFEW